MNRMLISRVSVLATLGLALGASVPTALAERADRSQPMTIEADKPSTVDMSKQIVVFSGNVVITQGTMRIDADRVEVREVAGGWRTALATGLPGKPATFRQKRDGVDEYLEGSAARIEYESRGDVVRFVGQAVVRRLRGNATADEVTGNLITYDSSAELFSVQGGNTASGEGRVRAVLTPRAQPASEAASAGRERIPTPPAPGEGRR